MALKEVVKGLCAKTKCLFDVYTKEYIDKNIKVKGDFIVLETTVNITENGGVENYKINYPDGFNEKNCVILAVGLSNSMVSNHWGYDFSNTGIKTIGTNLYSNYIGGMIECRSDYGLGQKQTIKLVLMKI